MSGMKRISTDILTVLYCTVLYSTVPKYLSSTSSATVCKVADLMLVQEQELSRAPGCHDLYI